MQPLRGGGPHRTEGQGASDNNPSCYGVESTVSGPSESTASRATPSAAHAAVAYSEQKIVFLPPRTSTARAGSRDTVSRGTRERV